MKFLTRKNIIRLNQITIQRNGGNFVPPKNLLHGEQLDYVVEIINTELFGEPMYPSVADKAAVYMFSIISNHVFSDGNKRTGLTTALAFLRANGYQLRRDLRMTDMPIEISAPTHDKRLEEFTLAVASAQLSQDDCRAWFAQNIITVAPPGNPE